MYPSLLPEDMNLYYCRLYSINSVMFQPHGYFLGSLAFNAFSSSGPLFILIGLFSSAQLLQHFPYSTLLILNFGLSYASLHQGDMLPGYVNNLGSTSLTLFSIPAPSIRSFTANIHTYNFFFLSACLIHMCLHTPTFNFISHCNYIATTMTAKTSLLSFTVISPSKADETDSVSVG